MSQRLEDKVVIITGSGRGIGRAGAELFAREGASVVVADIDGVTAKETAQAIVEAGGRAIEHVTDVTDSAQVDALVDRAVAEFGRLDIMWSNAGGARPEETLGVTDEQYQDVIALNMHGVFYSTRAALRVMVAQKNGSILITTSGAGIDGIPGLTAYGMAKAAVINLAKSVAQEFGPHGIRANVIAPGPIDSEGLSSYLDSVEGLREKMEDGVPVGRLGQSEEIANAALFLASDEASYVSGVVVPVDGGVGSGHPTPPLDMK